MKKKGLLFGIGINDADYQVQIFESKVGNRLAKAKRLWICPYYARWVGMFTRCYSPAYKAGKPSYDSCSVSVEWRLFSTFKTWMEQQDWEGNHLDKDLLIPGNKEYSPQTCLFVSPDVNTFLVESKPNKKDTQYPLGVNFHKASNKFVAQCRNPFIGKQEHLGLFLNPQDAHQAWLSRKLELAVKLAELQSDDIIAKALINYYQKNKETICL